ncbi:uncharacterized protein [Watersipora subatra]|uniref:uncharacterized protein n=1 Tax=Watersipora subatra TaxID=2589382 RepID=UPI00355AFEC3
MECHIATWFVLLLGVLLCFTQALSKKQRDLDVTSFLSLFGNDEDEVSNTELPSNNRGKPEIQTKVKDHKCRCEEKTSRRLRREIKDISFEPCEYQGVGLDEERVLEFTNVTITPKPLIVPGDLFINFDMEVRGSLPESIQIDADVYKIMFDTLPVNVPCMSVRNTDDEISLGSCSYKSICSFTDGAACPAFSSNGLPCSCVDISPGHYRFQTPIAVIVPSLNSIFDILVKGTYAARFAFTDSRTKREIGCIKAKWKITKVHRDKEQQRSLFFKQRKTL